MSFKLSDFAGKLASIAAVGLGLVKVGATVVSLCLVDRVGRRTLLLLGVSLMAVSLLALTIFASYQAQVSNGNFVEQQTCSHHNSTHEQHTSVFLQVANSTNLND